MTAGLGPDATVGFLLVDIALIVSLAAVLGRVARRMGQPTIVGQIVAGVVWGPTLLGPGLPIPVGLRDALACDMALAGSTLDPSLSACLFPPQARTTLAHLGQLGLVLYMLGVGLGIDTARLRGRLRAVGAVSAGTVVVPLLLGLGVGALMHDPRFVDVDRVPLLPFQLLIGALLAITAFPVMAHMLQERRMDDTTTGVVALASAAVITVPMFLLLGASTAVASGGLDVLGLRTALVAAVLVATPAVLRPVLARASRRWHASDHDLGPLALVLVAAILWSLATHLLGVTVIVGAFLAGTVLPERERLRTAMLPKLQGLTLVVLVPVFLATSGLQTDLGLLDPSTLPYVGAFIAASVLAKWGAGTLAARLAGLGWREGHVIGALVNCRGLLPLVVALVAVDHGLASPGLQVAAVVMALVTTAMTGPLCDLAMRPERHTGARGPETRVPSTPPLTPDTRIW